MGFEKDDVFVDMHPRLGLDVLLPHRLEKTDGGESLLQSG